MIAISSQLFYLSFFQAAVKFHLPFAAGRTFTVSAAAAAAASQSDPVNMAARKDEARCNDSQYGIGTDTHGYPSFLMTRLGACTANMI